MCMYNNIIHIKVRGICSHLRATIIVHTSTIGIETNIVGIVVILVMWANFCALGEIPVNIYYYYSTDIIWENFLSIIIILFN